MTRRKAKEEPTSTMPDPPINSAGFVGREEVCEVDFGGRLIMYGKPEVLEAEITRRLRKELGLQLVDPQMLNITVRKLRTGDEE